MFFICNPRYEFNRPYSRLRGNDKESVGLGYYSPLSSRAKRGDPVNKKALRANARRHIALDCHSRTPTFSTLIALLRNDKVVTRIPVAEQSSPLRRGAPTGRGGLSRVTSNKSRATYIPKHLFAHRPIKNATIDTPIHTPNISKKFRIYGRRRIRPR